MSEANMFNDRNKKNNINSLFSNPQHQAFVKELEANLKTKLENNDGNVRADLMEQSIKSDQQKPKNVFTKNTVLPKKMHPFKLPAFNPVNMNLPPDDLPPECPVNISLPPDDLPPVCPVNNSLPPDDLPPVCPVIMLPPDDLPPPCPTDMQIIGEEGCKITARLAKRLEEFNDNGKSLSEKISQVSPLLEEKLSNLGVEKISTMPDDGVALVKFTHHVQESLSVLSKFSNPFPLVTDKIHEKPVMSYSDVIFTYNLIWDSIVNPNQNYALKARAISCTLLTLACDKLQKSLIDVSDFSDLLLLSMQRITRLGLFASDALKDFTLLHDLNCIGGADKQVIKDVMDRLQELRCRSQQLCFTVNVIQTTLMNASLYFSEYKRYSDDAVRLLEFTKDFVGSIIQFIMEEQFEDAEIFSKLVNEKIQNEFVGFVNNHVILISDKMYFDFKECMNKSRSNRKDEIDQLVKIYLHSIHENPSLSDDQKLFLMKQTITITHQNINSSLGVSIFGPRKSFLVDELSLFILNDFNKYVVEENKGNDNEYTMKKY